MNAISLFSGMGGDTLGMTNAGFKVVAYNENNKAACESHEANWAESVCIVGVKNNKNIREIPDSEFQAYKGKVNLVFAGFPCQGFSQAGQKLPEDPRNTLFREFVRVVKNVEPEYVLGENVKGILTRETSEKELFKDVIMSFLSIFLSDLKRSTKYSIASLTFSLAFFSPFIEIELPLQ